MVAKGTQNTPQAPQAQGPALSGLRPNAAGVGTAPGGNQAQAQTTAHGPESKPHAYDAPNLTAKQFLYAVMRDTSLDLRTRMKAADRLCHIVLIERDYVQGEWANREPVLEYRIEGFKLQ